jgi:hypothetical protein
MRCIKVVIAERQNAYANALKLFKLKQKGVDIDDPETRQLIATEWANEKFLERHRRTGYYLKGKNGHRFRQLMRDRVQDVRGTMGRVRQFTIKKKRALQYAQSVKTDEALKSFRVVPGKVRGKYALDMTPVRNRRHRTNRHVGKFRIAARSDV